MSWQAERCRPSMTSPECWVHENSKALTRIKRLCGVLVVPITHWMIYTISRHFHSYLIHRDTNPPRRLLHNRKPPFTQRALTHSNGPICRFCGSARFLHPPVIPADEPFRHLRPPFRLANPHVRQSNEPLRFQSGAIRPSNGQIRHGEGTFRSQQGPFRLLNPPKLEELTNPDPSINSDLCTIRYLP